MAAQLRALLVLVAITVVTFIGMSLWYGLNFRPSDEQQVARLKGVVMDVAVAVRDHDDERLNQLLDRLSVRGVVLGPERQVISSNLSLRTQRQRIKEGEEALNDKQLNASEVLPGGQGYLYYRLEKSWLDGNLIFPLLFSLLLGLILSLREFLLGAKIESQERAIGELTDYQALHHTEQLEQRVAELRQQVRGLQTQLQASSERAREAEKLAAQRAEQLKRREQPTHDERLELERLKNEVQRLDKTLQAAQIHETTLQQLETHLKEKNAALSQDLKTQQRDIQGLAAEKERLEAEITQLHQAEKQQAQTIVRLREREKELEAKSLEAHDLRLALHAEERAVADLLRKQEDQAGERIKLLSLMGEQQKRIDEQNNRLDEAKHKLHDLSVAYKQQLELNAHLPDDWAEVREQMALLIAEKDSVEHENGSLAIELQDKLSEINRLRKELEARHITLEDLERTNQAQQERLERLQNELSLLGDTLSDKLQDLELLQEDQDSHEIMMAELISDRDRYKLRNEDLENRIMTLFQQKESLQADKLQLQEKLAAINEERYQFQIEQLKQSVQMLNTEQQKRSGAIAELKTKLQQGADLYDRLKRLTENKDRENARLHQEIERYQSMIALMEDKLAIQDLAVRAPETFEHI